MPYTPLTRSTPVAFALVTAALVAGCDAIIVAPGPNSSLGPPPSTPVYQVGTCAGSAPPDFICCARTTSAPAYCVDGALYCEQAFPMYVPVSQCPATMQGGPDAGPFDPNQDAWAPPPGPDAMGPGTPEF